MEIQKEFYTLTNPKTLIKVDMVKRFHPEFKIKNTTTNVIVTEARDILSLGYEYEITDIKIEKDKPE